MRHWIELCSDVNWIDYHGMWARKARDGSWYVLQWTNMIDACGERDAAEIGYEFECQVKRLDIGSLPAKEIDSALQCCGNKISPEGIVTDDGDVVASGLDQVEQCILECCIQYGHGAPLHTETGSKHPLRIRAAARRYAESMMGDGPGLRKALDRPVNAIGSTAEEYGKGDIDSAPDDPKHALMRRLHGLHSG